MTKKHDELVEEIRDQLHRLGDVEFDYIRHLELPVQEMDVIKEIITLVLSAVRDGLDLEELAALEHEQWMYWSKAVAGEVLPETRARWEGYWVPYEQLSEDVKEHDRVWARKIIALSGTGKEEET